MHRSLLRRHVPEFQRAGCMVQVFVCVVYHFLKVFLLKTNHVLALLMLWMLRDDVADLACSPAPRRSRFSKPLLKPDGGRDRCADKLLNDGGR